MKRTRKVTISILSIAIALAAFMALAFFLPIPLGEPIIDLDFVRNPPWHLNPGKSFQVQFTIVNEAWLLAATKDMKVAVATPEGLTVSSANTNNYEIIIGTLRGGDTRNYAFNITASISSSPGTYTLTIRTYGQNIAEKTLSPNVVIELPRLLSPCSSSFSCCLGTNHAMEHRFEPQGLDIMKSLKTSSTNHMYFCGTHTQQDLS